MKRDSAGFTLIEIVIAVSILAAIVGVAYGSLTSIMRSKKLLDEERDLRAVANSVLTRMTRELQLAYSGVPLMPPRNQLNKRYSSKVNLIGTSGRGPDETRLDRVTFIALEGGQYLPDGGSHSGLVQLTYRAEQDPEDRGAENEKYYLVREESPYIRPYERAYEKTMVFPVTDALVELHLRYFDAESSRWVEEWLEDNNRGLPRMVEFSITLRSNSGKLETFTTSVPIRTIN